MTERSRNDLYYLERLSRTAALYPDGRAGLLDEREVEITKSVPGRRPDRPRTATRKEKKLVQLALYDDLEHFRAADKVGLAEAQKGYHAYDDDPSWSMDDLPDDAAARFSEWKESLNIPDRQEIIMAADSLVSTSHEAQTATVQCKWCQNVDPKYACYGCGYARAYYKYPLIRLYDDDGYYDEPFDVARFIKANPDALSYEVRTKFDSTGRLSAEQVAVLRVKEVNGTFVDHGPSQMLSVDTADELYGEITLTTAVWREDSSTPEREVPAGRRQLRTLIKEMQHKCAVDIVREQTDTARYQELYDQFIDKIHALGKRALAVVIQPKYFGMGDSGYYLRFGELPMNPYADKDVVASSSTVRWLIEKVLPTIDTESGTINSGRGGSYYDE